MSTISGVGSGSNAWADVSSARQSAMKARMFGKADTDGSGGVDQTELQNLFDKVAKKTGATAASASEQFSKMDTNGDGSLSSDELSAGMKSLMAPPKSTVDFAQRQGMPSGPPPGGGGGEGGGSASTSSTSSSSSTSYDPLDTNQDGVVSAQERAAGVLQDLLKTLTTAMDSNKDGNGEIDSFKTQLASAFSGTSASASTTSASSSQTSSDSSATSGSERKGLDFRALQTMVRQAYSQAAADASAAAGVSLSA
jgi:Ca2+-binding EF-hand superfamily protein